MFRIQEADDLGLRVAHRALQLRSQGFGDVADTVGGPKDLGSLSIHRIPNPKPSSPQAQTERLRSRNLGGTPTGGFRVQFRVGVYVRG